MQIGEPDPGLPFEAIGGEARVRELVERFYDLMELDPRFADLRALHGSTLENARNKLFWFLCGWLGGPAHYIDRFGHPMLRARHLPFAIDSHQRDLWMACMTQAMSDVHVPETLVGYLKQQLYATADWMRNRPDAKA